MSNKVVVIGGGTVSHVRKNLALSSWDLAPEAKKLAWFCLRQSNLLDTQLLLTDMAMGSKHITNSLSTPHDISERLQLLAKNPSIKMIFYAATVGDFDGAVLDVNGQPTNSGEKAPPLKGQHKVSLSTGTISRNETMLSDLRKLRPDIFLVSFHKTFGLSEAEQQKESLNFLKATNSDLVVSIDQSTNFSMVVTPEGDAFYTSKSNPVKALDTANPMPLEIDADIEYTMIGAVEMAYTRSNVAALHGKPGVSFPTVGCDLQFGIERPAPPVASIPTPPPGTTGLIGVGAGWAQPDPAPAPPPALPEPPTDPTALPGAPVPVV